MERRSFIKNAAMALASLPIIGASVVALAKKAGVTLIKESDPAAKALKYVADATKAKGKKDLSGVKAKDQHCHNCSLYMNEVANGDGKAGKCAMLGMKYVDSKGWCMRWTKKA